MKLIIASYFLLILTVGCISDDSSERTYDQKKITDLRQEIIDLVDSSVCNDDSECAYIAFGSKPCGGPWEYLVYSTSIDTQLLLSKVEEYNATEKAYNEKWGIISDCMYVTPPEDVICEDGKCKAVYPEIGE
ncbi:MAG: hypothetical protein R2821_13780 [Flavobacteriaceae bacterium]